MGVEATLSGLGDGTGEVDGCECCERCAVAARTNDARIGDPDTIIKDKIEVI